MRAILSAVLAIILLTPANASSKEITFVVSESYELLATFGSVPFSVSAPIQHNSASVDGEWVLPHLMGSWVEFVSGPLLSKVTDPSGSETVYTYGPGTLTITADFYDRHDVPRGGSFAGTVPGLQLTICEGCDVSRHASKTNEFLVFGVGPGTFDADLARELGIYGLVTGGSFDFGRLIDITGGPDWPSRDGISNWGNAILSLHAIPEPSLLALYLTFGGVSLARRRGSHPRLTFKS